MKSILIIADYFGTWPKWFGMYLKSCELNPTVHWLIHTDCALPAQWPSNVTLIQMSQLDYMRRVCDRLRISFRPRNMYNICNLRPTFGVLYASEIRGYDFFGWSDIDVIYGHIRHFYTEEVLMRNVICSSSRICTGHLTLMRNRHWLRHAFLRIDGWRARLENPEPCEWSESLDEAKLSGLLSPCHEVRRKFGPRYPVSRLPRRFWNNNYFHEQWTTPFTPGPWYDGNPVHPEVWYWRNGHLTNARDRTREFLYLHLMNFKAPRYVDLALYQHCTTWDQLPEILHFDCTTVGDSIVRIDRQGIHLDKV
jgi:hypothetical protein